MLKIRIFIKTAVCNLLYYTGLFHLGISWTFRKRRLYPAVIINYHRFVEQFDDVIETHPSVTHSIDDFKKEILFLNKYFDIRSLDDVVERLNNGNQFDKPTIVLTIDDGYKDNFDLMFPVLRIRQIPATIFLSTGVIGTNNMNWYDYCASMIMHTRRGSIQMNGLFGGQNLKIHTMEEKRSAYNAVIQKLKDIDIKERDQYLREIEEQLGSVVNSQPSMLNWNEVRSMSKESITFGAHTHTHPILTNMPIEDAKQDIGRSKQSIEKNLGLKVSHFAYPNGREIDFNEELRQYCREIGFSSVSSMEFGNNQGSDDIWSLKRIGSEAPIGVFAFNVFKAFQSKG